MYTAVNGMHNRLIPILNCMIISEKVKNHKLLTPHYCFPNSSPLHSLLSQINAVHYLHSISNFPINRDIPTDQVNAGFLIKSSYVLPAFFIHLVPLSTILMIRGKRCTSWPSKRCGLHRTSVTSKLLGPNTSILSLCSQITVCYVVLFLLKNEN